MIQIKDLHVSQLLFNYQGYKLLHKSEQKTSNNGLDPIFSKGLPIYDLVLQFLNRIYNFILFHVCNDVFGKVLIK